MSASGGGKTTLLNLLSGREGGAGDVVGGEVLFGGRERDARTRRSVAYCTQSDVFFERLTVREVLEFTASMVCDDGEEGRRRVEEAIQSFGLQKCKDTIIGTQDGTGKRGVSGGERRRCSLANEMIARPSVLLADEVTSGLDATTALNIMEVLRRFADEGGCVVASVHQVRVC